MRTVASAPLHVPRFYVLRFTHSPARLHFQRMFTGIVERTVSVIGVTKGPKFNRLTLAVDWPDVKDGESVSVNGVCLTVADRGAGTLGFDVIQETLCKTNLSLLNAGDEVHVERSLRIGDRLD